VLTAPYGAAKCRSNPAGVRADVVGQRGVLLVADHLFVGALADNWQDVRSCLRDEDLPLFTEHIRNVRRAPVDEFAARVALDQMRLLLDDRLPDRHPVRHAMSQPRSAAVPLTGLPDVEAILAGLVLPPGLPTAPDGGPGSEQDLDDWLLSAPSLTEHQLRALGGEPERSDLIRLPGTESKHVLPAFQFGPDGEPHSIVSEVNCLLDAAGDPWGVADWWLGENAWLGGVPAALLGHAADSDLRRAAQAELPDGPGLTQGASSDPGDEPGQMRAVRTELREE
jgi:hypothetical protein